MQEITLKYPVCNIDGLSLLPEGSAINKKNLRNVANLNSKTPLKLTPLLSHKTVKDDITSILNNKDYADVYSKKGCKKMILEQMSQVHLPAGVYGSLDYFKKNDTYSYHHFLSVFSLTTMIASEILTDEEMQLRLLSAGPTHDIGKTCVPLYILQKATSLLRKEKQILDEHSSSGYLLMSHYFADPDHISAVVARDHHERRNGMGRPRGIDLDDILIEIIVACDIYDALISPRPYRKNSFDKRSALEEITTMAENGELSWKIVKALISLSREDKPHFSKVVVTTEKRGKKPKGNLYGTFMDDKKLT